jgi:16S rRNA (adenine1518-N6/adenine1519-N6)-dimethyltransferase
VDSTVFEINIEKEINEDIIKAYKVSKSLFLNRRKTIFNNLSNFIKDKELARSILKDASIMENLRPEQIPPEKFLEISLLISKIKEVEDK